MSVESPQELYKEDSSLLDELLAPISLLMEAVPVEEEEESQQSDVSLTGLPLWSLLSPIHPHVGIFNIACQKLSHASIFHERSLSNVIGECTKTKVLLDSTCIS